VRVSLGPHNMLGVPSAQRLEGGRGGGRGGRRGERERERDGEGGGKMARIRKEALGRG
jgi:hypothetical protein